ncbi:MAG TPA: hypothetical protein DCR39_05900 [Nitrospiraceae bacterium]|nr:hypothetical protein [Nitrospiraceae bacterium]
MNIQAYSNKDIQHCAGILQQALSEGITEVTVLLSTLNATIDQRFAMPPSPKSREIGACPECGGKTQIANVDRVTIIACRKCRWSKMVDK